MMSREEVKQSLKRIIHETNGITSSVWDQNFAQNVGYTIKQLEERVTVLNTQIESLRTQLEYALAGKPLSISIKGVNEERVCLKQVKDDHWSS